MRTTGGLSVWGCWIELMPSSGWSDGDSSWLPSRAGGGGRGNERTAGVSIGPSRYLPLTGPRATSRRSPAASITLLPPIMATQSARFMAAASKSARLSSAFVPRRRDVRRKDFQHWPAICQILSVAPERRRKRHAPACRGGHAAARAANCLTAPYRS